MAGYKLFQLLIPLLAKRQIPLANSARKNLDLNVTFMQTSAVKRVKLIFRKGTNGSLTITCLSAANVSTLVEKSDHGAEWLLF